MGWSIDAIVWFHVRDKILKDKFAGVAYSMLLSDSPVIIRHRGELEEKDMVKMADLFPKNIRVEFQEVDYEGEITTILERLLIAEILVGFFGGLQSNKKTREFMEIMEEYSLYGRADDGWVNKHSSSDTNKD